MQIRNRTTDRMLVLALSVLFVLVGSLSAPLVAQEDDSETVTVNSVAELFRSISSSEELNREAIVDALEGLSEEVVAELEEQGVPEEAIDRFNDEFSSALTLFEEGLITKAQLGEEAAGANNRLGQEVEDGLPVELLEENGINTEAIQKLKEGAETLSGPEVAGIANSIAGKEDKGEEGEKEREETQEKQEEAKQQGEEKKEEGQEKAEEKEEEAEEKKEEAEEEKEEAQDSGKEEGNNGQDKGESESEGNSGNNGR